MTPTLYLCTPTHDGRVHIAYHRGCLRTTTAFYERIQIASRAGSLLPRNRDMLTDGFLDSQATHMLCVDSDIGFGPEQVQALLDLRLPFVAGTYVKKQANCEIPAHYTGESRGEPFATLFANGSRGKVIDRPLWRCKYVPAGFMLLERATVERMAGAYRALQYNIPGMGMVVGLWSPDPPHSGEDVAFCKRWTDLGGEIWLHRGIALEHHGDRVFLPDEGDTTPERANREPAGGPRPEPKAEPHPVAVTRDSAKPNSVLIKKLESGLPLHVHPDPAL